MALRSAQKNTEFRFLFDSIKLIIPRVHVLPSLALSLEKQLSQRPASYCYKNFVVRSYIINSGLSFFQLENAFQNDFLPEDCFTLFTTLKASNGEYSSSILHCGTHGISDLYYTIDNQRYNRLEFDCDWDSKTDFMRPYMALFENQGSYTDLGSWINPERFRSGGYAWFRQNFRNSPPPECDTSIEPSRSAQVRLTVKFKTPPAQALRMYILTRRTVELFLDEQRSVLRNFIV